MPDAYMSCMYAVLMVVGRCRYCRPVHEPILHAEVHWNKLTDKAFVHNNNGKSVSPYNNSNLNNGNSRVAFLPCTQCRSMLLFLSSFSLLIVIVIHYSVHLQYIGTLTMNVVRFYLFFLETCGEQK